MTHRLRSRTDEHTTCFTRPRTIVEKIWDEHVVIGTEGAPTVMAVDLHLVHEVTSPQAFDRPPGARPQRPPPDRRPWPPPTTPSRPTTASLPILDQHGGVPGPAAGAQLRRVRHPALRHRLAAPGHRPRHRPRARADAAGHDHRLRRLAHRDARRVRSARLRHRHQRGRERAGHPVAAAAPPEDLSRSASTAGSAGRLRQGHHPGAPAAIGVGGGTGHVFEYTRLGHPRARRWRSG